MAQVFKLFRLQQFDSQIDQANNRLRQIEALQRDETEVQAAQSQVDAAVEKLRLAQQALRKAESQVQALRIKIEQNQAALYGGKIRNPKELQDLQHESAALERQLGKLEDEQLEAMLQFEDQQAASREAETFLAHTQAARQAQLRALAEEQHALGGMIERLTSERSAAASTTPADEVQLYEELRKKRNGVAVAQVTDRFCSACGATLSAALLHSARSPFSLTRCDMCGRILYAG
jgi:hypothetical protein